MTRHGTPRPSPLQHSFFERRGWCLTGGILALTLSALACTASAGTRQEIAASTAPWELSSAPYQQSMPLTPEARSRLVKALGQAGPGAVALHFDGVQAASRPGGYYEVYVDLSSPVPAAGGAGAQAAALDPENPRYAGNLSLFGLGSGAESGGGVQDLPLAPTLRRLRGRGLWRAEEVSFTLVPRGEPGSVRIERVAITVE